MQFYRWAATNEDLSDLTDTVDIASNCPPWRKGTAVTFTVTKTPDALRSTKGRVVLSEGDVIALHQSLVAGLQARAEEARVLEWRIRRLKKALTDIYSKASLAEFAPEGNDPVAEIKRLAEVALDVDQSKLGE